MGHEIMRTEVIADCYAGDNCDEVRKQFKTYCAGDMDSETHDENVTIRLRDLPVGAVISVTYPTCQKCGEPRQDDLRFRANRWRLVGHHEKCSCGFDWNEWILDNYS